MRKLSLFPLLAAVAAVVMTSAAGAHSNPVRFDPAPGSVLSSAPAEVTGWFTSDIRNVEGSFINVLNSEGDMVSTGDIELTSDRRQMSTALEPGLGEGRYLVHWSTMDDGDGHPATGCYVFFVGQAAAEAALEAGQRLDGGSDCPASDDGHSHGAEHDASVSISIPAVVSGDSATLQISPVNFTPRAPQGNSVEPGFGHYHIYLDKVPVDILTGGHTHDHDDDHTTPSTSGDADENEHALNPGGLVENPIMWVENSYTFTNLEPGFHTVTVVLNYDDHTALDPPVLATQTFLVEGDGGSGGVPTWVFALGIIGGLVLGGAGVKLLVPRS